MRFVQVAIPADLSEPVHEILGEADIDALVIDEQSMGAYDEVLTFVLPTERLEGILDQLREVGVADRGQTVILDAETVISEGSDLAAVEEGSLEQIARQELQTRAMQLMPSFRVFVVMTVISAIVATAGLLLDSPAVVVGSMVIAPLIGPAISGAVGTVVNDPEMFRDAFVDQAVGILLTVASAAAFAAVVQQAGLVPPGTDVFVIPEVAERTRPDLLALFIALGAGVAGAVSMTRDLSTALVGVMIAAALIPPAAAAGIAIALWAPVPAIGAGVLTLVNLVSINLMGLLTLWYMGYRPSGLFELSLARRQMLFQALLYGAAVVVLSSFLFATTATSIQHAAIESSVDAAIDETLAASQYEDLVRINIELRFAERVAFGGLERVQLTLGDTASSERYPTLPDELQAAIAEQTGQTPTVQVRFVPIAERAGS